MKINWRKKIIIDFTNYNINLKKKT